MMRSVQYVSQTASASARAILDLREITGWQRNRRYRYEPYLILFGQSGPTITTAPPDDAAIQTTGSEGVDE